MLIGISGMIGAGKSTLTNKLTNYYKNSAMLSEFENDDEIFNTFLQWLYEKKPNLALSFQTYVVENHTSKLDEIINLNQKNNNYLFLDRFSIEHYIFAYINLKNLPKQYWNGYQQLFNILITKKELPNLIIYLDMNFDTFKKRLFARGRKVEIDNWESNEKYFKTLYQTYKPMFIELAQKYNLNYFIIETDNLNENEVFEKAKKIIENKGLNNDNSN
ncbi:deoxynucleoside kinase [Mycoplasma sp. 744]|uniref:deoxynucleoside kinase n=1 Tax=Mycoplasma sp. 744 TaxID=3108531 RepID=UPI002B1E22B1|nr:deoxynucleoside kinase [Mycoplasma sp. 744]MEA4115538.1 deoxynucleoside kinase [Mycoplasma sp. 744]